MSFRDINCETPWRLELNPFAHSRYSPQVLQLLEPGLSDDDAEVLAEQLALESDELVQTWSRLGHEDNDW